MTSVVFIFLLWAVWVIATFLLEKNNPYRAPIAIVSLLLLISYPIQLYVFKLPLHGAILLLLLTGYILAARLSFFKQIYLSIAIVTTTLGYAGLHLVEMYDPIWVLIDRRVILSTFLFALSWLLSRTSFVERYIICVVGSIHGEFSYAVFLLSWDMHYYIGAKGYMDTFAYTIIALVGHYLMTDYFAKLKNFSEGKKPGQKQILH